ncbi:bifunctional diaminohydroxyphosphoribosylaminopyrimidine deaminase/5-amino-6-(5-phosphoribosylamino)uracil reductase RibD [Roseobacter sp. YSTF-M11]|uniref:Riboflavin biosynthesis protein RibD n=1 Tax=Roseobacter insulae TaxID=2859783 RepID=A0A9X1K022_9RHOB|nr:bifunctional diaminohydroxyphosphoribosylaminopyrimidine deaminase/5-amino-6-(5-phosphoribosylamino)uracil reductase RibD [Roseobacter insulae]MBW4707759.1 bifunctional diaminohydroxyphosphoribosylaminopyrimidine deaminase/5-amino-6-(5-phosphoribosylamino)uracil reductase RibD [Roseobacter insulae]
MSLALSLGRRGQGRTWPNPAVGCVIVKDGRIVGRGWTQPGGRPHAETEALAQAGSAAAGADVYVSLEPCAHHGETPPCAQALIDAKVARVIIAVPDIDPRVGGKGSRMLSDAGIAVEVGMLEEETLYDNAGFFTRLAHDRPFVTLKLASSFDGRIATATGESKWITGPGARRFVHAMRARHDAVIVGGGTARKDDPSLTVRDLGIERQPVRVVVSRRLDLPLISTLARTAKETPVILCHGRDADPTLMQTWRDLGADLLTCEASNGQLDARDVMRQLAEHGLTRVFCEGGSALAASLIEAGLVDDLVGFTAGLTIGAEGLPSVGALGLSHLEIAPRFALQETHRLGNDVVHVWRSVPR